MRPRLLAFLLTASVAIAQNGTTLRHVTVIDVGNGAELKDRTVLIQGDRIASVAPTVNGDASPGAIDAQGLFLIPGLWDMHVHVHNPDELALYIANGVTGIRVMAGQRDEAHARAELASRSPAPEIYLASAIVDGSPPVWPESIVVKNENDARKAVQFAKASGADFVKVYERLSRTAYFAIADESRKQGIPFAGHVPDAITANEASEAGQRSIEHLTGIAISCSRDPKRYLNEVQRARYFRDRLAVFAEAYRDHDGEKCSALFNEFRRNETWQVPTLTVLRLWGQLDNSHFITDKRLSYIGKSSRNRWETRVSFQDQRWPPALFRMARDIFVADKYVVGTMFRAGVPIMAGTDAMNPYCFPGFSLHDELALLVESGLSPLAALQSATVNPAVFLGRSREIGRVGPGMKANLVLLSADPLADIHNTTRIEAVWLNGNYFDRAALDRLLAEARQHAAKD